MFILIVTVGHPAVASPLRLELSPIRVTLVTSQQCCLHMTYLYVLPRLSTQKETQNPQNKNYIIHSLISLNYEDVFIH
jgi:hypothetical protein